LVTDRDADPDIQSLHQIIVFGIKSAAAYIDHAQILGLVDKRIPDYKIKSITTPDQVAILDKNAAN